MSVRDIVALCCLAAAVVVGTVAGFTVDVTAGLYTFAGLLLIVGILLGRE